MPTVTEGRLQLEFPSGWTVEKYDDWGFYRNQFEKCCMGNKAMDFLALDSANTLWLIELKDYRQHRRQKPIPLWEEVALKARDTLAGLVATKNISSQYPTEAAFSQRCISAPKVRVILHLEQPVTGSKLFPRPFDRAHVQQKLAEMLKPIDAHPKVVELHAMRGAGWQAQSI